MELQQQFEAAVEKSKTLKEKPDNNTLLQLYSLYKQGSEGDAPEKGDYGMFDFVGKVKHDAWLKLAGMTKDQAMKEYTQLVDELLLKEG